MINYANLKFIIILTNAILLSSYLYVNEREFLTFDLSHEWFILSIIHLLTSEYLNSLKFATLLILLIK